MWWLWRHCSSIKGRVAGHVKGQLCMLEGHLAHQRAAGHVGGQPGTSKGDWVLSISSLQYPDDYVIFFQKLGFMLLLVGFLLEFKYLSALHKIPVYIEWPTLSVSHCSIQMIRDIAALHAST